MAHQRLLARLAVVAPTGSWALKGGQALLARLGSQARTTKDAVYDERRVQDAVLALRHLNTHTDSFGWQAWKSFPWEATDGLHERGLIDDPRSKARSVALTDECARLAEELFSERFGVDDTGTD